MVLELLIGGRPGRGGQVSGGMVDRSKAIGIVDFIGHKTVRQRNCRESAPGSNSQVFLKIPQCESDCAAVSDHLVDAFECPVFSGTTN